MTQHVNDTLSTCRGDIAQRLRQPVMYHSNAEQTNAERREAAAEIERLREIIYQNCNGDVVRMVKASAVRAAPATDTTRTALDIIRDLQEPAGQFGKSMTLCREAAELLAVLNSGNDAICRKNDELQATIKQLTDALAVRAAPPAPPAALSTPLTIKPLDDPNHDPGDRVIVDADGAHIGTISNTPLAEAAVAAINFAPCSPVNRPVEEPVTKHRWPHKGDRMRFLGENGYEHERAEAMRLFVVGQEYEVIDCEVGDWHHTVAFVGKPGRHNGVMFELTTQTSG